MWPLKQVQFKDELQSIMPKYCVDYIKKITKNISGLLENNEALISLCLLLKKNAKILCSMTNFVKLINNIALVFNEMDISNRCRENIAE